MPMGAQSRQSPRTSGNDYVFSFLVSLTFVVFFSLSSFYLNVYLTLNGISFYSFFLSLLFLCYTLIILLQ